jgi:hypothetical protein
MAHYELEVYSVVLDLAVTAGALLSGACLAPPPDVVPETLRERSNNSDLNGSVVDADTSRPLKYAHVTIKDLFGRTLEVNTDDVGLFRFENIPPGKTTITVSAPAYSKAVTVFMVEPRTEIQRLFPIRAEAP